MVQAFKFTKTLLTGFLDEAEPITIKDTTVKGLYFTVGEERSVFTFEKRIKGSKKSAPTITIGAFPAISVDEARAKAHYYANQCENGIDPRVEIAEARAVAEAAEANNDQHDHRLLLSTAITKFFEVKSELSKHTLRGYREIVRLNFPEEWIDLDIRDITADMIVDRFYIIRQTQKRRCWAFVTLFGNIWNTCMPYFKDEEGKRLLGLNPNAEVRVLLKNVKRSTPRRTVIPVNILGQYLVTLEELRNGEILLSKRPHPSPLLVRTVDLLRVLLFTGFRFIEAQNLKWEFVNLEEGFITLPGTVRAEGDDWEGTKNGHEHSLPLSSYVWDVFRQIWDKRTSSSPFVFPSIRDPEKPICAYHRAYKLISALIGTPMSPHTNRRTLVSAGFIGLDMNKLIIQRLLNHHFKGGTTDGYIVPGFDPGKPRKIMQQLCDYILDRRAEYLGQKAKEKGIFEEEVRTKFQRLAIELGLTPEQAAQVLARDQ